VAVNEGSGRHEQQSVRPNDANPDEDEYGCAESVEDIDLPPGVQIPDKAEEHEQHADGTHRRQTLVVLRYTQRENGNDAEH